MNFTILQYGKCSTILQYGNCSTILQYGKCSKNFKLFIPYFFFLHLHFMLLLLKMLNGTINKVDLDEQSDVGVHYLHTKFCQKLSVQNFKTFTSSCILETNTSTFSFLHENKP